MRSKFKSVFGELFEVEPHEKLKVVFLAITFFLVIAGYTLAKDLKDSIFISVIGREWIPRAKFAAMFVLIPALFGYSLLADRMRRYKLLCFCSFLFGILGLIFTYFVGHPTIGIANTDQSPYRIFGWLFYFFVEGYTPFVLSVFWAFANSITSPEAAKKNYGLIVSGSKMGGMLSAGLAWALFSWNARTAGAAISDITLHQIVVGVSSLFLLLITPMIFLLMKKVPGQYLHGYEAAYKVEKQKRKLGKEKVGVLAGLRMLLQYPYVLGIFGMVFFFEVLAAVLAYMRLGIAQANGGGISGVTSFLFQTYFYTHLIGFFISVFGTRTLLSKLGTRTCLLLIPSLCALLIFYFMINLTPGALVLAFVTLKSINYAFSWPVRESLYIPTIKEIKFKSKAWIDAFGSKFAKTSGSAFNEMTSHLGKNLFLPVHSCFFALIIGFWLLTAFMLGKRFDKAILNNEVIGVEPEEDLL